MRESGAEVPKQSHGVHSQYARAARKVLAAETSAIERARALLDLRVNKGLTASAAADVEVGTKANAAQLALDKWKTNPNRESGIAMAQALAALLSVLNEGSRRRGRTLSRRDPEPLQDILDAIEAIKGHVARGDLSDGRIFDAVRVR